MHELKPIPATHIVATPGALDAAVWPNHARVLRIAADEALVIPPYPELTLADPHAIIEADSGYAGVWLPAEEARAFLSRACEWQPPDQRPAFAQGMAAGIPAKFWLEEDRVLCIVPAPYAHDFEERLA